jgi:hypothetical protein
LRTDLDAHVLQDLKDSRAPESERVSDPATAHARRVVLDHFGTEVIGDASALRRVSPKIFFPTGT